MCCLSIQFHILLIIFRHYLDFTLAYKRFMPEQRKLLEQLDFGQRVAELESSNLSNYFVQTYQWKEIYSDGTDIVFGPKGTGKSAIYALLLDKTKELAEKNIEVIPAENPRGAPAFDILNRMDLKDQDKDPLEAEENLERKLIGIWKLYFLILLTDKLKDLQVKDDQGKEVIGIITEAKLIPKQKGLREMIRSSVNYIKNLFKVDVEGVEGTIEMDPGTGLPKIGGKILFKEPSQKGLDLGFKTLDDVLDLANGSLEKAGKSVWITIDRLDVTFTENKSLEKAALRALFRVYRDLPFDGKIKLKIFIRDDIWERITEGGFTEFSHFTRNCRLEWKKEAILNLIASRLANNTQVLTYFGYTKEEILSSTDLQMTCFNKIFPIHIDQEEDQLETLDWILTNIKDGNEVYTPREVIHLLNEAKKMQIRYWENGQTSHINDDFLISDSALLESMPEVSKTRLTQTLYAEHANYKSRIESFKSNKTEHCPASLSKIWDLDEADSVELANEFSKIGFFKKQIINISEPRYLIPNIYHQALDLKRGTDCRESIFSSIRKFLTR